MVFFVCFFVFGREEKYSEIVQVEHRTQEVFFFFFFWSRGYLGPFLALTRFSRRRPFKGCPLQTSLDQVDLDTLGKILTSCF